MIVKPTSSGWEIIHQQAHGMLALQLALQWPVKKRPMHWIKTIVALTEHDDGQEPWEGKNHLNEAGAPLNFQMMEYSVEQCRNVIQIGLEKSRWNALMVSMHTSYLYEPKRGVSKELNDFLDEQKRNQKDWCAHYQITQEQAEYAYSFIQWCDALSLILCQDQIPAGERRLEISPGPDGTSYYIFQRSSGTVGVEPWPFMQKAFTVEVESYEVDQMIFKDDKELFNAMQQALITEKKWIFKDK